MSDEDGQPLSWAEVWQLRLLAAVALVSWCAFLSWVFFAMTSAAQ